MKTKTFFSKVMTAFCCMFCLFCCCYSLTAQEYVYECNFENAREQGEWHFLSGSRFANGWTIGNGVFDADGQSMYISFNQGKEAGYSQSSGSAIAYRNMQLIPGKYYKVSFDWKSYNLSSDELYVCWVHNLSENVDAWATNNHAIPSGVKMYGRSMEPFCPLVYKSGEDWQHNGFIVRGSEGICRLVFYWTNNKLIPTGNGAYVDNITIEEILPQESVADYTPFLFTEGGNSSKSFSESEQSDITAYPQIVLPGGMVTLGMSHRGTLQLYSPSGSMLLNQPIDNGESIVTPEVAGLYLLVVSDGEHQSVFRIMVNPS